MKIWIFENRSFYFLKIQIQIFENGFLQKRKIGFFKIEFFQFQERKIWTFLKLKFKNFENGCFRKLKIGYFEKKIGIFENGFF